MGEGDRRWVERASTLGCSSRRRERPTSPVGSGRIESIEVAARVHGRQVHWGLVLDVVRLTLRAARTDEKTGHVVWPEFGYDGPIPDRIRRVMPEPLRRFATLLDLLEDDEGADWWQAEGRTIDLTFELKPGSRSRKRWNEYWTRKGLDPNARP